MLCWWLNLNKFKCYWIADTDKYGIEIHGLNFNPTKTIFTTFGRCTFANSPHWQLNGSILRDEPNVNYLGTVLSNNPTAHTDARVQAARGAFYGLQSSGMCEGGVSPVVSAHMYI